MVKTQHDASVPTTPSHTQLLPRLQLSAVGPESWDNIFWYFFALCPSGFLTSAEGSVAAAGQSGFLESSEGLRFPHYSTLAPADEVEPWEQPAP